MGVGPELTISESVDPRLLVWPKNLLTGIYAMSIIWCAFLLFVKPMHEEEYVIRMIYMIIMVPLVCFIWISHRWAMTGAIAAFTCFITSMLLFVEGRITIGSVLFMGFLAALTWRSMQACIQLDAIVNRPGVDVFE